MKNQHNKVAGCSHIQPHTPSHSGWLKKAAIPLLALPLTGCLQVQLFGTLSDAEVIIEPLAQPGSVVYEGSSTGRDPYIELHGIDQWNDWGPILQMHMLGLVATGKNTAVADDQLYLVTVSGGYDEDATDKDGAVDSVGTLVSTPIHAILTGAQIKGKTGKVSLLTEALYQSVAARGDTSAQSSESVTALLNESSALLVDDINGDGSVDYTDVLAWSHFTNAHAFKGDSSALNALGDALIAGASTDADLQNLASEVLSTAPAALNPLSGSWRFTIKADTQYCSDGTASGIAAIPTQTLELTIVGDEITVQEGYFPPLPGWDINSHTPLTGSYYAPLNRIQLRQEVTGYADASSSDLLTANIRITGTADGNSISGTFFYNYSVGRHLCEVAHPMTATKIN